MKFFAHGLISGLGIGLFLAALLYPLLPADGSATTRMSLALMGIAVAISSTVSSTRGRRGAEVVG